MKLDINFQSERLVLLVEDLIQIGLINYFIPNEELLKKWFDEDQDLKQTYPEVNKADLLKYVNDLNDEEPTGVQEKNEIQAPSRLPEESVNELSEISKELHHAVISTILHPILTNCVLKKQDHTLGPLINSLCDELFHLFNKLKDSPLCRRVREIILKNEKVDKKPLFSFMDALVERNNVWEDHIERAKDVMKSTFTTQMPSIIDDLDKQIQSAMENQAHIRNS